MCGDTMEATLQVRIHPLIVKQASMFFFAFRALALALAPGAAGMSPNSIFSCWDCIASDGFLALPDQRGPPSEGSWFNSSDEIWKGWYCDPGLLDDSESEEKASPEATSRGGSAT
jgi:hypothetical protein